MLEIIYNYAMLLRQQVSVNPAEEIYVIIN